MKKEIKKLLEIEEGNLKIKKDIYLRRYSENALKEKCDVLKLELNCGYGKYNKSILIETRNIEEIINLIILEIKNFYLELGNELSKEIENGYIG